MSCSVSRRPKAVFHAAAVIFPTRSWTRNFNSAGAAGAEASSLRMTDSGVGAERARSIVSVCMFCPLFPSDVEQSLTLVECVHPRLAFCQGGHDARSELLGFHVEGSMMMRLELRKHVAPRKVEIVASRLRL